MMIVFELLFDITSDEMYFGRNGFISSVLRFPVQKELLISNLKKNNYLNQSGFDIFPDRLLPRLVLLVFRDLVWPIQRIL